MTFIVLTVELLMFSYVTVAEDDEDEDPDNYADFFTGTGTEVVSVWVSRRPVTRPALSLHTLIT